MECISAKYTCCVLIIRSEYVSSPQQLLPFSDQLYQTLELSTHLLDSTNEHLYIYYNYLAGIYLLYRGECIANNTLFLAGQLTGLDNGLQCLMAVYESTSTAKAVEGRWWYPNGTPVECVGTNSSNINGATSFTCSVSSSPNRVILYNEQVHPDFSDVGSYSCCFPSHCDGNNSSLITAVIDSEFEMELETYTSTIAHDTIMHTQTH